VLDLDDTIAAVATASGAAGLAVVRLSGARALAVADAVFEGAVRLAAVPGNTLHHGWAVGAPAPGTASSSASPADRAAAAAARARLDEVVAAVFRAPRSYTRQNVVEFSCHGGALSARRVLEALLAAGARLARPGEFTLRAFLHGRLDLVQAEAVADLIHAESAAAHDLALAQLRGEPSRRIAALGEALREALAEVEARVDFLEDVGGVEVPAHVVAALAVAEADLAALLAGAAGARALREGARVVLAGRPNAGKSSLFNALLGEPRAIVATLPGTTRDVVSEVLEVAGVRVTLTDTAGWRDGGDSIENEGVARARAALEQSAVVVWVVDGAAPLDATDRGIAARLAGRRVLVALNKADLPPRVRAGEVAALAAVAPDAVVAVSAARGDGVPELRAALGALLTGPRGLSGAVANPRHVEALGRTRAALARAREAAGAGAPGEIVALELREGLAALGEVTGETIAADALERIFSRFCIGK